VSIAIAKGLAGETHSIAMRVYLSKLYRTYFNLHRAPIGKPTIAG
jgi:hypothetical protein